MEKEFKTYDELINVLKNRGMDFPDLESEEYAKNLLSKIGYYRLINGYSKPFLLSISPDKYKSGTSIKEIHSLYQFDENLRRIFLKYTLIVENNVKSLVAYHFSEKYGHKNYLLYNNFDTSLKDSTEQIMGLISDIQRQIASRTNDPCISHYLRNHGYIPLWVLNNILTFGNISKFYSLMKPAERKMVSKEFDIQDHIFKNCLIYLTSVRNYCAHSNRLYCYRISKPLLDSNIHSEFNIPKNKANEYCYGKRDLFAGLIALKSLLSKNDFTRLCDELSECISKYKRKLHTISINDITSEMGFPNDWIKIKKMK